MKHWLHELRNDLTRLEADGLLCRLRTADKSAARITIDGRTLVNFASNDYLGLAQHPKIKHAAIDAIERLGCGAGASRLVSGTLDAHRQLEKRFAAFKHAEDALLLPTGYMANRVVLATLAQRGDLICLDKLSHASLIDAAGDSGAMVRVYPHLQTGKLDRLLGQHHKAHQSAGDDSRRPRRFIVTDSVFSMDGDAADLPALCDLAERHDAVLVVDEAHGTGVLGETGAGLCELQHVADRVDIVISTASKALGSLGGIVTAKAVVIETLLNRGRSFMFTTAPPPVMAATINAALDVIADEPQRRERVLALAQHLYDGLARIGWPMPAKPTVVTPIVPLHVGEAQAAVELAEPLMRCGMFAPAIRPPAVAPGSSRLRVSLRADLEVGDVDRLLETLSAWRLPAHQPI